ncbi:MAG TPA: hypothetical protein VM690_01300 [Gaiellaceae bacterium]|nr:hypothetical protein [Gaiellaceae bacterium]
MSWSIRIPKHGIAALICLALGVLLVLLALDVRTWQTTVQRDDMRFRVLLDHRGLWRPQPVLPGDPAGKLLGTGDTVAMRRAEQYFWFSRIGRNSETQQDLPTLRAEAQDKLAGETETAVTPGERSQAANLLGVLIVTSPVTSNDPKTLTAILVRAIGYFQRATALDPGNVDAEQNLELALRLRRPGGGRFGRDARSGYGFGRGHGTGIIGSGY